MRIESENLNKQITECRKQLTILKSSENVSIRIASFFIENTAYWDHPSGCLVKAPKYAKNISLGKHGLEIRFGGNYFLVDLAIARCVRIISQLIDLFEIDEPYSHNELIDKLNLNVRGAVANNNECEYEGYYPCIGNNMFFGTQVINVKSFVGIVIETSRVNNLYRIYYSEIRGEVLIRIKNVNLVPVSERIYKVYGIGASDKIVCFYFSVSNCDEEILINNLINVYYIPSTLLSAILYFKSKGSDLKVQKVGHSSAESVLNWLNRV